MVAAGILLARVRRDELPVRLQLSAKPPWMGRSTVRPRRRADCFRRWCRSSCLRDAQSDVVVRHRSAALVWAVVTGYSMTSALGHAALNRLDTTTGQRAVVARTPTRTCAPKLQTGPGPAGLDPSSTGPCRPCRPRSASVKDQRLWIATNGAAPK